MLKKQKITYVPEEGEPESKIKRVKKELEICRKEKEEYLSQAQRAQAELINFRRRQEQILAELREYGQADLIRNLLPVLDTLTMAAKGDDGAARIKSQLEEILKQYGLMPIDAEGGKFDPQTHEAIDAVELEDKGSGEIIEEAQKGYMLKGKVLRPSKVRVVK